MATISFVKPIPADLDRIRQILRQWNDADETEKYVARVDNEIHGTTEFDMRFWVVKVDELVIGMGGLSNCQPKLLPYITTPPAKELKTIYLDNSYRHHGYGSQIVEQLTKQASSQQIKQLLLVSAYQYKDTAYDFYQKMGFDIVGWVEGSVKDSKMAVFSKTLLH